MQISPELAAKLERPLRRLIRRVAQRPGRACIALLVGTVTIGGALYSVLEKNANWFDGVWWATVTLTTVGYGDYSPHTFLGRWLAAFVMAGGIGAVAILTGILADEIRQARLEQADYTPDLSDDLDKVLVVVGQELDKLRAKVSHPEVVAALKKIQLEVEREIEEEEESAR
jgi:voltage-gated potassium channel Kch